MPPASSSPVRCQYCGQSLRVVWVHGHGQCASCGVNIDPCCGGAPCPATPSPNTSFEAGDETRGDQAD